MLCYEKPWYQGKNPILAVKICFLGWLGVWHFGKGEGEEGEGEGAVKCWNILIYY